MDQFTGFLGSSHSLRDGKDNSLAVCCIPKKEEEEEKVEVMQCAWTRGVVSGHLCVRVLGDDSWYKYTSALNRGIILAVKGISLQQPREPRLVL